MDASPKARRLLTLTLFAFLTVHGGNELLGQENVGKIVGSVLDPSGAALPGAEITATHLASGQQLKAVSTVTGDYVLPVLPIGEYSLRASASGFKTVERPSVRIVAGVTVSLNFTLEIGQVTETV